MYSKERNTGNILLIIAALIWGSAFVAQSAGMKYIGPFTYGMSRSLLAFAVLIPVVIIFRKKRYKEVPMSHSEKKALNRKSLIGGIFCGLVLTAASSFQQVGISMTTAGKAGFITTLYIIIVPIFGIFLKKHVPKIIWFCVVVAVAGFYLLCVQEGFYLSMGDLLCLICAFCFSAHIMVIDHFTSKNTDPVMMSCVQFIVMALISTVLAFSFETPVLSSIWDAKITILYAGALSGGVAYTLQIIAQKNTIPAVATLLMSLESVFAVLFGWLILNETLSLKEFAGCVLVFAAVILSQIKLPHKKERGGKEHDKSILS